MTREACQEWIDQRVMRFKNYFVHFQRPNGEFTCALQRGEGSVVDTKAASYKKDAFDEPLSRMAKPARDGEVWRAVIPTSSD